MTGRAVASWCRRGDHLSCASVEAVCACPCHDVMQPERVRPGPKTGTVDRAKASGAAKRREAKKATAPRTVRPAIAKEDAPCCVGRRDKLGRLPIGFCSEGCARRPVTVSG